MNAPYVSFIITLLGVSHGITLNQPGFNIATCWQLCEKIAGETIIFSPKTKLCKCLVPDGNDDTEIVLLKKPTTLTKKNYFYKTKREVSPPPPTVGIPPAPQKPLTQEHQFYIVKQIRDHLSKLENLDEEQARQKEIEAIEKSLVQLMHTTVLKKKKPVLNLRSAWAETRRNKQKEREEKISRLTAGFEHKKTPEAPVLPKLELPPQEPRKVEATKELKL